MTQFRSESCSGYSVGLKEILVTQSPERELFDEESDGLSKSI